METAELLLCKYEHLMEGVWCRRSPKVDRTDFLWKERSRVKQPRIGSEDLLAQRAWENIGSPFATLPKNGPEENQKVKRLFSAGQLRRGVRFRRFL